MFIKTVNSFSGVCRRKLWFLVFLFIHVFSLEGGLIADCVFHQDQSGSVCTVTIGRGLPKLLLMLSRGHCPWRRR